MGGRPQPEFRVDRLHNVAVTDEVLAFVAKLEDRIRLERGRGNLNHVAQTIGHARTTVQGAGFLRTGAAGEAVLEGIYGATTKGVDKQVWASTKAFKGKGRYLA